jgi:replicative DNA helicase
MKKDKFIPKVVDVSNDTTILHDAELEKVVLGAILIENDCLDELGGMFTENLFYDEKNQLIARAILDLFVANEKVDILTTTIRLRSMEQLEFVGGAYYISALTNRVSGSAHIEYHVRILQQYSLARQINELCNISKYKLFNGDHDVFDVYEELQVSLEGSLRDISKYQISSVSTIYDKLIETTKKAIESGGTFGVPTGLRNLDEKTNGWQSSDLIIVAGRPGMGKTAIAISMMLKPALIDNIPVAFFSLEMSNEQLVGRMVSGISGISASRIIKKQLTTEELDIIQKNAGYIKNAPIYLDDTPNISLIELKTKARRLVRENGVKAIFIDYLQLMRSGLNIGNREQEISEISRGLKALAKELNIPVIALSQLSRMVESRSDKKPMLSDLRESGQIEQDADLVLFTYRPTYYGIDQYELSNGNTTDTYPTKTESFDLFVCIIAKHRNGGIGEVVLSFLPKQTRVTNYGYNPFQHESQGYTNVENNKNQGYTSIEKNTKFEQKTSFQSNINIEPNNDFLSENSGNTNIDEMPF